jgi:UDP-N-acetylglucosamine transferase subunit ALG13
VDGPRSQDLIDRGERVVFLPEYQRSAAILARHTVASIGLARAERPRYVVTSGAGHAVPFVLAARALGARVVFTETMARITSPSASGRVLSRTAALSFVQWPELVPFYPRSTACRPTLLQDIRTGAPPAGVGTFVTVGSHTAPFDRMLETVAAAARRGLLPQPVLVQRGPSTVEVPGARIVDFLPADELREAIERSRVVIAHGGAGTIAMSLRAGRRPLAIARRSSHGEHFDDHQLQLQDKLAGHGLVVAVNGSIEPESLAAVDAPLEDPFARLALRPMATLLERELRATAGLAA